MHSRASCGVIRPSHHWKHDGSDRNASQLHSLLHQRTVGLLLVGQPFRAHSKLHTPGELKPAACSNAEAVGEQLEAYRSVVTAIIRPLEACGAWVELLYTFPRNCPAHMRALTRHALTNGTRSRVAAVHISDSMDHAEGVRQGRQLLAAHLLRPGVISYDFVLQARHDIFFSQQFTLWPTTLGLDRLLFEQECASCSFRDESGETVNSCSCGRGDYVSEVQQTQPGCREPTCTRDHLVWVPRVHLGLLLSDSFDHDHGMLTAARASSVAYGFLFPQHYCAEFTASVPPADASWRSVLDPTRPYAASFMHLECVEQFAYRPFRVALLDYAFR